MEELMQATIPTGTSGCMYRYVSTHPHVSTYTDLEAKNDPHDCGSYILCQAEIVYIFVFKIWEIFIPTQDFLNICYISTKSSIWLASKYWKRHH